MNEDKTKSGLVSIIGRTNVGKSTLLNHLIEQKVSITSRKPQTTRFRVLGIKTKGLCQAVIIDTPGYHRGHKRALNKYMNKVALSAMTGIDILLFVIDLFGFGKFSILNELAIFFPIDWYVLGQSDT